jgi:hypothetical protein
VLLEHGGQPLCSVPPVRNGPDFERVVYEVRCKRLQMVCRMAALPALMRGGCRRERRVMVGG